MELDNIKRTVAPAYDVNHLTNNISGAHNSSNPVRRLNNADIKNQYKKLLFTTEWQHKS